jgi:phenylpyruvate tautomerase PptA (4-oxalocrotonate tautomerase family)
MDGAMVDEVTDQIVDLVGCKPETIYWQVQEQD